MANRIPLIVNPDASQIQELPASDTLVIGEGGLGVFGNTALGNDSTTDEIILNARFRSHLVPSDTNRNLGESTRFWNQAHIGTVNATTLNGNGVVPIGGIIMWSGTVSTIPSNFKLCDGNNNTPNLTNKFIIGAISDQSVSGITTAATTITGSNTRDGGTKDAVTVTHDHKYAFASREDHLTAGIMNDYQSSGISNVTDHGKISELEQTGNPAHPDMHGFTANTDDTGTNTGNIPPFYALAFIIRTS